MTTSLLEHSLLDVVCDAHGAALLVIDRDDMIVFSSSHLGIYFPVPELHRRAGARLRDYLGSIYDHVIAQKNAGTVGREEWIADKVSAHWRERFECTERLSKGRIVKLHLRRLPSGFGICVVSDVTEQKKREENWRADQERIEITEAILDNLPMPVFVLDDQGMMAGVNRLFASQMSVVENMLLGKQARNLFDDRFMEALQAAQAKLKQPGQFVPIIPKTESSGLPIARLSRVEKLGRSFDIITMLETGPAMGWGSAYETADIANQEAQPIQRPVAEANPQTLPLHHAHLKVPDTAMPELANRVPGESAPATKRKNRELEQLKVLAVSANTGFGQHVVSLMMHHGAEACAVTSTAELQAFLSVARSADVRIGFLVIDRMMGPMAVDLAHEYNIHHRLFDVIDLERELLLAAAAAKALSGLGAQAAEPLGAANPTALAENVTPLSKQPQPETSADILVVEDNEVNQIVFSQILEGLGRDYRLVATGKAAMEAIHKARPAVLFLDISLPDMNGLDLARTIRQTEKIQNCAKHIIIIGVLVPALEHQQTKCIEAGMDSTITKPLSPDMLEQILNQHGHFARHAQLSALPNAQRTL